MAGEVEKLRILARHAWTRRWWLLGIQVLAAIATLVTFYVMQPKYRSTTTIRFEPETVLNPLTQGLAVSSRMENIIGTMRQELLRRNNIVEVLARTNLIPESNDPMELEKAVNKMAANTTLAVTAPRGRDDGASLFQVSFTGTDPHLTKNIAETTATLFIEKIQDLKRNESDAAYDFISSQLEIYRLKLEASENALRDFEERHLDELPEHRNANISRLESLRATLRDIKHRIDQARIQKDLLIKRIPGEEMSSSDGQGLIPNPLVGVLREKENELQSLKRRYSDNYPDVISLKAEVKVLREEVGRNPTVPVSEARSAGPTVVELTVLNQLQQVDVELETLSARVPSLEKEIAALERKVQGIPQSEQELVRLQRDYDVNSNIYEMFLRRLEEARVSRELEQAKKGDVLRVVEEANLPLSPYSPARRLFFLIGLGAGLAVNGALLYWIFSKDTSFRSARDAEDYLGIAIIARIPQISVEGVRRRNWINALSFSGAIGAFGAFYVVAFYWEKLFKLLVAGA